MVISDYRRIQKFLFDLRTKLDRLQKTDTIDTTNVDEKYINFDLVLNNEKCKGDISSIKYASPYVIEGKRTWTILSMSFNKEALEKAKESLKKEDKSLTLKYKPINDNDCDYYKGMLLLRSKDNKYNFTVYLDDETPETFYAIFKAMVDDLGQHIGLSKLENVNKETEDA